MRTSSVGVFLFIRMGYDELRVMDIILGMTKKDCDEAKNKKLVELEVKLYKFFYIHINHNRSNIKHFGCWHIAAPIRLRTKTS